MIFPLPRRDRFAALLLLSLVFAVSFAGCGTAPVEVRPQVRTLPVEDLTWVVDPLSGYPLQADEARKAIVRSAYTALRQGAEPEEIAAQAQELLDEDPEYHPARVLWAQARYVGGRAREAAERLAPLVEQMPDYVAAALLHARALEELGDVAAAYAAYSDLSDIQPVAARRADRLRQPALDVMHSRFDDAMIRGRLEEAEEILATIADWDAESPRTYEARRMYQVATGDAEGELETLRSLIEWQPTPERRLRAGILELEVGDLRAGIEGLEALDPESLVEPSDRDLLTESIERGQFLRRLDLLPPRVREKADLAELTRADLASLVYWLFPALRFAPVENPPIAADILDHPDRQEILKVAGLEVMEVDQTVHRFYPERPITRSEAIAALLRLLMDGEPLPACLADDPRVQSSQAWICNRAVRCRLIGDVADCLPAAPISGPEALAFFRHALAQLGAEPATTDAVSRSID